MDLASRGFIWLHVASFILPGNPPGPWPLLLGPGLLQTKKEFPNKSEKIKALKNLTSFDNNQLIKEQSVIVIIFYKLFGYSHIEYRLCHNFIPFWSFEITRATQYSK